MGLKVDRHHQLTLWDGVFIQVQYISQNKLLEIKIFMIT